jgi:hypothetical protein
VAAVEFKRGEVIGVSPVKDVLTFNYFIRWCNAKTPIKKINIKKYFFIRNYLILLLNPSLIS